MELEQGLKPTSTEREQFWQNSRMILKEEIRIVAWVVIILNVALAVEDWMIYPGNLLFLYSVKLSMIFCMLSLLVLLRKPWGQQRVEILGMAAVVLVAVLTVFQSRLFGISYLTPMIAAFAAALSAGMLSWRLRSHFVLMSIFFAAIVVNDLLFYGELGFPVPQETVGGIALTSVTIVLAHYSDKRRFALWKAQRALAESEMRFRQFAESSKDIIWIWSPDHTIQYVSPAYEALTGQSPEILYRNHRMAFKFVHPEDRVASIEALQKIHAGEQSMMNLRVRDKEGNYLCFEGWGTPVYDNEGVVIRCIVAWRDVTERTHLIQHLDAMSTTDPLTQLYNRRFFFDIAKKETGRATRNATHLSVILFDIDHFKRVNDTWGHVIGDQVLTHFATVCQSVLRTVDVFARYGGEEFVVLLPEADADAAYATAERLRMVLVASPFALGEANEIDLSMSLGVTTWTPPTPPLEINSLLQQADEALYAAKQAGRNRTLVWQPEKVTVDA